jgi:hypothetical protein
MVLPSLADRPETLTMVIRRSPTLLLLFSRATSWDVTPALDEVAEQFQLTNANPVQWCFPSTGDWRVLARFDEKALERYAEQDRRTVDMELGATPSAVLHLTLNWRSVPQARGAARTLVLYLLQRFDGIADEMAGNNRIWNLEQIRRTKNSVAFLDCYR